MFVQRFGSKVQYNFKEKISHECINSISKEEMIANDILIDCSRKITIFDNSCILNKTELMEDYILVENRVVHRGTPLAYDMFFPTIELSYMYSAYLFSKPRNPTHDKNGQIYLLYGFSTGYGDFKRELQSKNNISFLDYGFSLLDKVNNFDENSNLTYKFQRYKIFNDDWEFFGPIFPNIYTEDQWEYIFKEKYKPINLIEEYYYLKDLSDNTTIGEKTRFPPVYINEFEIDSDYFSMSNFERICYLLLFYHFNSINIIYHTIRGINFTNIVKEFSFNDNKNLSEMKEFYNDLKERIDKTILFYRLNNRKDDEFLIMISATPFAYSIEINSEKTGKKLYFKLSKAEMLERIFSNFTLNSSLIASIINDRNKDVMQKQILLGYRDENELEDQNNNYIDQNLYKNTNDLFTRS